jgi:UDP-glucose 4-epimerase
MNAPSVLITGAAGYIGHELVRALAAERERLQTVVATDVREVPPAEREPGIEYAAGDVRDAGLADTLEQHKIDTVVHLAAIVTPGKQMSDEFLHSVDVRGTENVLECCLRAGVRKVILMSSGAAYGYHADNPGWLREDDALRGNDSFAYSRHKRLVEEMLSRYRNDHPELQQLIFRPGAILGDRVANQITDLFEKRFLLAIRGAASPFVFIWDRDVVACLLRGIFEDRTGIYNLAGDGVMTVADISRRTGTPVVSVPAAAVRTALAVLHPVGLSQYGPEQVDFVRYRPVLANDKLKDEFGYTPQLTTAQVFDRYWRNRGAWAQQESRLDGKIVVITGAAGGIGSALARCFGHGGARLALLDRDGDGVQSLAAELTQLGMPAWSRRCDVTSTEECASALAAVCEEMGGVDILVNNAGQTHLSHFADTDVDVLRKVMDVNFFGAANCTKAALPSLIERRGQIVVLSSVAGFAPLGGRCGYAASKHALHGLFESMRAELQPQGVHVMMVCPGFTDTGIGRNALGGDGGPPRDVRTTTGKAAPPESVAAAILDGIQRRRRLLVLSSVGKLSYLVSRVSPSTYEKLMARALM